MNDDDDLYGASYVASYRGKSKEGRLDRLIPLFELGNDDEVLDVGCGSGFLLDHIGRLVKSYVGIDTSLNFINEAKIKHKKFLNASFINESSTEHIRQHKNHYSKIFLIDVSEHLNDEVLFSVLNDCHRMLKKNGSLFIHTPNGKYFLEILKALHILKQTRGHIAVRSLSEYVTIFKKTEFHYIESTYLNHYLKKLQPINILSFLPIIGDFAKARIFIKATH